MIDSIRLSEKAKQQLILIKRKTGIENWNVLCRWALLISLAENTSPPYEDIATDSSIDISWKVFTNEFNELISTLLKESFHNDSTYHDFNVYFKLHLHRGISFLNSNVSLIDDLYK
ncbi:DNA sulfur modification protein DndE [Aeromonas veronii]|uniref:DNA sulfur modification protein DndE n=1 Tax=Aeromonas veronii TaxID=654 RepID=A0A653KWQ2_AERVE|nr:DNA sulfur modification protein DndE [Aeromonas veronii]